MWPEDLISLERTEHDRWTVVFCKDCMQRFNYRGDTRSAKYNECGVCNKWALYWCYIVEGPNHHEVFTKRILNPALLSYEIDLLVRDFKNAEITYAEYLDKCHALRARLEAPSAVP